MFGQMFKLEYIVITNMTCAKCRYRLVDIDIVGAIKEVSIGKVFKCLADEKDPKARLLGIISL